MRPGRKTSNSISSGSSSCGSRLRVELACAEAATGRQRGRRNFNSHGDTNCKTDIETAGQPHGSADIAAAHATANDCQADEASHKAADDSVSDNAAPDGETNFKTDFNTISASDAAAITGAYSATDTQADAESHGKALGEPNSGADGSAQWGSNSDSDSDADVESHGEANCAAHREPNGKANSQAHSQAYSQAYSQAHGESHARADLNCNTNFNTNTGAQCAANCSTNSQPHGIADVNSHLSANDREADAKGTRRNLACCECHLKHRAQLVRPPSLPQQREAKLRPCGHKMPENQHALRGLLHVPRENGRTAHLRSPFLRACTAADRAALGRADAAAIAAAHRSPHRSANSSAHRSANFRPHRSANSSPHRSPNSTDTGADTRAHPCNGEPDRNAEHCHGQPHGSTHSGPNVRDSAADGADNGADERSEPAAGGGDGRAHGRAVGRADGGADCGAQRSANFKGRCSSLMAAPQRTAMKATFTVVPLRGTLKHASAIVIGSSSYTMRTPSAHSLQQLTPPAPASHVLSLCVPANSTMKFTHMAPLVGILTRLARRRSQPTRKPTTAKPTALPTQLPTTSTPTSTPTLQPTSSPTQPPTSNPTSEPTQPPTPFPTQQPTSSPTQLPTSTPTLQPTATPTQMPTPAPTAKPTTARPTPKPTPMPTAWPTYAPVPAPPDPYCSRGFVSADNTVCCQAGCTRCSDTDCALLPPGVNNCCPATIAGNGRSCSLTDAPCNVQVPLPPPPATSDPYCVDGILDPKGTGAFCCARGCTLCGKSTCANDFYGAANCCGPNIVVANQSCNSHVAPCVVSLITNPPPVTAADKRRPVTIGVLPAPPLSLSQREAAYNMTFDSVLMYMKVGSVDYSQVVSYLNRGKHVDLVLEFQSTANLTAIMNGVYDSKLRSVGLANVADNKREINVRIMHEFNEMRVIMDGRLQVPNTGFIRRTRDGFVCTNVCDPDGKTEMRVNVHGRMARKHFGVGEARWRLPARLLSAAYLLLRLLTLTLTQGFHPCTLCGGACIYIDDENDDDDDMQ
ncbi:hypothetical protein JKP88DRAFT_261128 [Tribonema minus]|uniref:Uncharacterized protein n=1 Tax=Tribonema minus TaxID=303371 RepID=A0A836CD31_9STRA|nr:hypothetical protein JKP88DRAFT_261128 [Tribonema minus]